MPESTLASHGFNEKELKKPADNSRQAECKAMPDDFVVVGVLWPAITVRRRGHENQFPRPDGK